MEIQTPLSNELFGRDDSQVIPSRRESESHRTERVFSSPQGGGHVPDSNDILPYLLHSSNPQGIQDLNHEGKPGSMASGLREEQSQSFFFYINTQGNDPSLYISLKNILDEVQTELVSAGPY
ncbi:unnamed protein product [Calypogeia fissa]